MRVVEFNRQRIAGLSLTVSPDGSLTPDTVIETASDLNLPDGLPFVIEDDGTFHGCHYLNRYLYEANAQSGLDLGSMRRFHVYHLARLLRFVRARHATLAAQKQGVSVSDWVNEHGEPRLDLVDVDREDLVAYRDSRRQVLEPSTLSTEIGCLSGFFRYALEAGWIEHDPVPRWSGRNTLMPRVRRRRVTRFLSPAQTTHFLETGLRGDGSPSEFAPASPERDYCFGLVLATTGLRREESAYLLDCEVPSSDQMPSNGVYPFARIGKRDVTRTVYVTSELAATIDLYRRVERDHIVERSQRSLRKMRRDGRLFSVDGVCQRDGRPHFILDGSRIAVTRLTNEQRAVAVTETDEGVIEPLGLFLSTRGGLPVGMTYWNELFANGRDRVEDMGSDLRPPQHITVTPHTLRHTFAVRMLHALMREGHERSGNPYELLSNPLFTVMQLLGHASIATTQDYLFAAETWTEEVPAALRQTAANLIGSAADPVVPSDGADLR